MKIKTTLTAAMLMFATAAAWAQQAPKTEEFNIDGLKVILRHSVKGTVSARLFIEGGVNNYNKSNAGIADLAYETVVEGGPAGMSKQEFQGDVEKIGATLSAGAGYDYSTLSLNCVKMYWDRSWDLFAASVVEPAFREDDFELVKNKLITAAKQSKANPDAHLRKLAMQNTWSGTDYETDPSGTPESLEGLTLPEVQFFYQKVVGRKRAFLVVVGDVSRSDLERKVKTGLANMPIGSEAPALYKPQSIGAGVYIEDRPIETNYIVGVASAPAKGSKESVDNALAMSILYDRFFEELRTKRSLSYAPAARATGYAGHPMNMYYITTTDPEQSLDVMIALIDSAKTEGFDQKDLDGTKQSFLTTHYMRQETNASISMSLGVAEARGDWRNADLFTDRVLAATVDDLNTVMRKYGNRINWTYLGKEDQVKPGDFKQPVGPKKVKD